MTKKKQRVLVYCPHLGGHRPIYCLRICTALAQMDAEVFFFGIGFERNAQLKVYSDVSSPFLDELGAHPGVEWIERFDRAALFTDEIGFIENLKKRHEIDSTVFVDGDALIPEFLGMKSRGLRFSGKSYALFIRSEFIHAPADMEDWKERLLWIENRSFFRSLAVGGSVLDAAFLSDDMLVEACSSNLCIHMPDVILPTRRDAEIRDDGLKRVKVSVEEFLGRNKDKRVFVFFGDLENRKGFDFLLRYCCENVDTVLLRFGATKPGYSLTTIDDSWRKSELVLQDRIFELDAFVQDIGFINYVLSLADFFPLPYVRFFRTSALMLDVIVRGKPVLVPDEGLMGYRVRKYEIGRTFKPGSYEDFCLKMNEMRDSYRDTIANVQAYASRVSEHSFQCALAMLLEPRSSLRNSAADLKVFKNSTNEKLQLLFARFSKQLYSPIKRRKRALNRFVKLAKFKKVAVFGGGAHAQWLEAMTSETEGLKVEAIIDNKPNRSKVFWGCIPELAVEFDANRVDCIFLATEAYQKSMKRFCKKHFGSRVKIVTF